MLIRTLRRSDTPQLLDLWQRRWGRLFSLDEALWNQQTLGDPEHSRPDLSSVLEDETGPVAFVGVKTPPPVPAWPKQDPQKAWISYVLVEPGREGEGQRLLEHTLSALRALGYTRVAYGSDPAHFFPGVPLEDAELERLLLGAGFEPGSVAQDFHRSLASYTIPEKARSDLEHSGLEIVPCGVDEVPGLLRFLGETFPGRWYYDTVRRLALEDHPSHVLILRSQSEVLGFCQLYPTASRRIGPGLYWLRGISSHPSGLGPIGISQKVRGMGLGMALLAYGVGQLKDRGAEETVIDWTVLAEFYGRLGFRPWRSYRILTRVL